MSPHCEQQYQCEHPVWKQTVNRVSTNLQLGSGASSAAARTSSRRFRSAAPCRPPSTTRPGHRGRPWDLSERTARNCTAPGTRAADYRPFCCGSVGVLDFAGQIEKWQGRWRGRCNGLTIVAWRLEWRLLKSAELLNGPAPVGKVPSTRRTVSSITAWRLHQVQHNLAPVPTCYPLVYKTGRACHGGQREERARKDGEITATNFYPGARCGASRARPEIAASSLTQTSCRLAGSPSQRRANAPVDLFSAPCRLHRRAHSRTLTPIVCYISTMTAITFDSDKDPTSTLVLLGEEEFVLRASQARVVFENYNRDGEASAND